MNIIGLIRDIFRPAVDLIDELHTSEEEKLIQKAKTLDTYVKAIEVGVTYEAEQLRAKAEIVKAEAESEHWLTSTWRPIVMLTFCALVVADQTGEKGRWPRWCFERIRRPENMGR